MGADDSAVPLGSAENALDWQALAYGTFVQVVYLLVLSFIHPLASQPVRSLGLLAATGVLGGVTAGRLTGCPQHRRARYGAVCGAIGGVGFAVAYWATMYIEWVPYGAYRYPTNLLVTRLPIPWYIAGYDPYVVFTVGLLAIPVFGVLGYIAGWAVPSPERSLQLIRW